MYATCFSTIACYEETFCKGSCLLYPMLQENNILFSLSTSLSLISILYFACVLAHSLLYEIISIGIQNPPLTFLSFVNIMFLLVFSLLTILSIILSYGMFVLLVSPAPRFGRVYLPIWTGQCLSASLSFGGGNTLDHSLFLYENG